jgi:uncharacterized membrane protein YgdD (TMEM256/DUF423 family)
MRSHKLFIFFAALFGLIAVIMGAVSSHAIEQGAENNELIKSLCDQCNLTEKGAELIVKATQYQFYHVAALFGVGILSSLHRNYKSILIKLSGISFILGIILFSGSLYVLAITGNDNFAKVVPFGGISFMLGWFFLMLYSLTRRKKKT